MTFARSVSTRAPLIATGSGRVDADEPGHDSIGDLDGAGFRMGGAREAGGRENTTKPGTDTLSFSALYCEPLHWAFVPSMMYKFVPKMMEPGHILNVLPQVPVPFVQFCDPRFRS